MSRASKRSGYYSQRGATNSRQTVSGTYPVNPIEKDTFIDTSANTMYRYDGANWVAVGSSTRSVWGSLNL